jgi:phosphate-selective porin OprO/OprP
LPSIPQPSGIVPAVVRSAPPANPIVQIGAQELPDGIPALPEPAPIVPAFGPAANTPAPQTDTNEWKVRIERLEKQNQDLLNALKDLQNRPVPAQPVAAPAPAATLSVNEVGSLVDSYLAQKEAQHKAADASHEGDGYKVGTDLRMGASWQNGVVFETPNKDFWMRAGFRFQWDNVWFHQSAANRAAAPVGVGPLTDGDYFRRIRPNFNGGFWEVGEFNVELKLETITNGSVGMDDVWVGVKDIPFLGTVRVGHFHLAHGLEADMYSSSKPMTFFEVSSFNNSFYGGERTGSGIWFTNNFLNERMTYAAMAYRPENASNGEQFQNADAAGILRLTGLPIYENDGRCLLHLGAAATWRRAQNGLVSFNTQAGLLDQAGGDNGYGNPAAATTIGTLQSTGKATTGPIVATFPAVVGGTKLTNAVSGFAAAPGNKTPWVTTGNIAADASSIFAAELLYINGPFSVQAEYGFSVIDEAVIAGVNRGNLGFTGGYLQVGYFLTGENRQYDKRLGRLSAEYIKAANTPFWLIKDKNGGFNYGLGAWELAARVSRVDLNSGTANVGGPLINGGILDQVEMGVNWHLNNNLRVQFMYIHADRYDLPVGVPGSWMNGFGVRTQLTF